MKSVSMPLILLLLLLFSLLLILNSPKKVSPHQEKMLYFKNKRHKNNCVYLAVCVGDLALICQKNARQLTYIHTTSIYDAPFPGGSKRLQ